jgi:hypothetical protein
MRATDGCVDCEHLFSAHVAELCISSHDVAALVTEYDELLKSVLPAGSFCRLSTRSPKDALLKVTEKPLFVKSGRELLMTLCSSARVFADVTAGSSPTVVLRPFLHELHHWSEMRVFVSQGRITAASAYTRVGDMIDCFLNLLHVELAVDGSLTASLSQVPPLRFLTEVVLPLVAGPFVADVAYVGSLSRESALDTGSWTLIELNPFSRATSACLFSWCDDAELLAGDSASFPELRLEPGLTVLLR